MTAPRRPRPDLLTRAEAEAMVRAAVAAERERSERAMAGVMVALGAVIQHGEAVAAAIEKVIHQVDRQAAVLGPMADAFAASLGLAAAIDAAPDGAPN